MPYSIHMRGVAEGFDGPLVGVVEATNPAAGVVDLLAREVYGDRSEIQNFQLCHGPRQGTPGVFGMPDLSHVRDGDILLLEPGGWVELLYSTTSEHNSLFVTGRCNSNCLMCSQPPILRNDVAHRHAVHLKAIPLFPKWTTTLGITGGEPTLLGARLVELLGLLKEDLPSTRIHMLTNGRAFAWKDVASAIVRVGHPHLVFGIPLHSDHAAEHDYVAQARHSFDQTILGLYRLASLVQRLEIRVVLHRISAQRLSRLAEFIAKNLPFVSHVALMGLEYVGYTPHNNELLWIEPPDYADELKRSVSILHSAGFDVSIYNLPYCLVPQSLWGFCCNSISDWKRTFADVCDPCNMRTTCPGLFDTSRRQSAFVRPVSQRAS